MHCWEPCRSLAAVAASVSAAAAAAAGFVVVVVGHVAGRLADGPLGLVLHGEQQLVAGCWLLYTLRQRKARNCCRVETVVMVIVRGQEVSSRTKPLRNESLSDSINTAWTTKKWYRERI